MAELKKKYKRLVKNSSFEENLATMNDGPATPRKKALSPSSFLVTNRRQFRKAERGSPTLLGLPGSVVFTNQPLNEDVTTVAPNAPNAPSSPKTLKAQAVPRATIACLDDESIALIFAEAARLALPGPDAHPSSSAVQRTSPLEVKKAVAAAARTVAGLVFSCKHLYSVFVRVAPRLRLEMIARAATQVMPIAVELGSPHAAPFVRQIHAEMASSHQLSLIKATTENLATHCAGPCCERSRKMVNREIRRRAKRGDASAAKKAPQPQPRSRGDGAGAGATVQAVVPALQHSTALCATPDGSACFVVTRRREGPKIRREFICKLGFEDVDKNMSVVVQDGEICVDERNKSRVQSIRCNNAGTRVCAIRLDHTEEIYNDVEIVKPVSVVQLWFCEPNDAAAYSTGHAPPSFSDADSLDSAHASGSGNVRAGFVTIKAPSELEGCNSVQDAWFDHADNLHVVYSTTYVHPSGSTCAIVDAATPPKFALATYWLKDGLSCYELAGPHSGRVLTASPTRDGASVALLVGPKFDEEFMPADPVAWTYDVNEDWPARTTRIFEGEDMLRDTRIFHEAAGRKFSLNPLETPSAVSFSPQGDRLVAIHKSAHVVAVEVLVRAEKGFLTVQCLDMLHLSAPAADPFGHASLRLPFTITFSACGRFAAVVDQRSTYGIVHESASLVILDLAMYLERSGVRMQPLSLIDDVSLRSLAWCERGVWAQARHGAIFLRCG